MNISCWSDETSSKILYTFSNECIKSKLNNFPIRFDMISLRLVMDIRRFKICGFDKIMATISHFPKISQLLVFSISRFFLKGLQKFESPERSGTIQFRISQRPKSVGKVNQIITVYCEKY